MRDWFDRNATSDDGRLVAEYMSSLASSVPARIPQMPDPAMLWVKAQMLRRWDEERRAQAPLDVMEPVQIAAGLAAAAVLFAWSFPSLVQALFTSI